MASSRNNTLEFSSGGSTVLGAADSKAGRIGAIQVVTETTFSTLTADNVDQSLQALTAVAIPAGTVLYGEFSTVAVTTGLAICHRY